MKSKSTSQKFSLGRLLLLLMTLGLWSSTSMAANDMGALELGKEYQMVAWQSNVGSFTAPATGTLSIDGCYEFLSVFKDKDLTDEIEVTKVAYGAPFTQTVEVTKDQTYYIYLGFAMDAHKITLSMAGVGETPLKITTCHPNLGEYYDLSSDLGSNLDMTFSKPVQVVGKGYKIAKVVNGEVVKAWNYPSEVVAVSGTLLSVKNVQRNLLNLMDAADGLKSEDEIWIAIPGLASISGQPVEEVKIVDVDGSGIKCTCLNFKMPAKPVSLVNANQLSKGMSFLSYWIEGAPEAKIELEFDGNVVRGPSTSLQILYGDQEALDGYYVENVPFTIEGNKVYADLSGKLRTHETMLPLYAGSKFPIIGLRLSALLDEQGNYTVGTVVGGTGSYEWNFPFTQLAYATVACEFTPANHTSLKGKENLLLWISGLSTLKFDGFEFSAPGLETVVVPKDQAKFDAEDENEGEYTIKIPSGFAGAKGTTVTLANLKATDGYNHDNDVRGLFDSFAITHATPANGTKMSTLTDGTVITVETNCAAQYPDMQLVYQIVDLNAEDPEEAVIKSEADMTRQADGSYTSTVVFDYKMYAGHNYRVEFTAWANAEDKNYGGDTLGSDYITWEGTLAPFKYSDIQFVSITPDPANGTISAEDNEFVIEFDGLVTLNPESTFINVGMGMTEKFESIVPVGSDLTVDGVSYANKWALTVSEAYMQSLKAQLVLSVKAFDMDNLIVKGTEGKEDQSFFLFTYEYAGRFASFDAYLEGNVNTATSVDKIYVSCTSNIDRNWGVADNAAYVMNANTREIVAYLTDNLVYEIDDLPWEEQFDATNTWMSIGLDKAVTAPGVYVVSFPENYFNIGTEFAQQNSEAKFYEFTIAGEGPKPAELNYTTDPEEGAVASLSKIEVTFNDYDTVATGNGMISVYRNGEFLEKLDADLDWDIYNLAIINLSKEYTEEGKYEIVVPAGYILLGDEGAEAPAFTLTYTISDQSGVDGILSTEGAVKVYNLNGVLVVNGDKEQIKNLPAGLYIVNGRKLVIK